MNNNWGDSLRDLAIQPENPELTDKDPVSVARRDADERDFRLPDEQNLGFKPGIDCQNLDRGWYSRTNCIESIGLAFEYEEGDLLPSWHFLPFIDQLCIEILSPLSKFSKFYILTRSIKTVTIILPRIVSRWCLVVPYLTPSLEGALPCCPHKIPCPVRSVSSSTPVKKKA